MTRIPDTALGRVEAFVTALERYGHGQSIVSCRLGHEAYWPGPDREYVPLHASDLRALVDENTAFRAGMVPRTIALGLACVGCRKCVGVFVTHEALDRWAADHGWRDGLCPDCLARPENCERCGGVPCSTCGECPAQGCWDCRCGQRERDDDERDGGDDE